MCCMMDLFILGVLLVLIHPGGSRAAFLKGGYYTRDWVCLMRKSGGGGIIFQTQESLCRFSSPRLPKESKRGTRRLYQQQLQALYNLINDNINFKTNSNNITVAVGNLIKNSSIAVATATAPTCQQQCLQNEVLHKKTHKLIKKPSTSFSKKHLLIYIQRA